MLSNIDALTDTFLLHRHVSVYIVYILYRYSIHTYTHTYRAKTATANLLLLLCGQYFTKNSQSAEIGFVFQGPLHPLTHNEKNNFISHLWWWGGGLQWKILNWKKPNILVKTIWLEKQKYYQITNSRIFIYFNFQIFIYFFFFSSEWKHFVEKLLFFFFLEKTLYVFFFKSNFQYFPIKVSQLSYLKILHMDYTLVLKD